MKRTLVSLAFLLIVPLAAFSQINGTPTPLITPPPNHSDSPGVATGLVKGISGDIITVKTEAANPMSFAISKSARFVDKKGKTIQQSRIKAGARVQVYYDGTEDNRTATRIALQD